MPDSSENKEVKNGTNAVPNQTDSKAPYKKSKVETAVFGFTYAAGFFFLLVSFFLVLLSPYVGGGFLSGIFVLSPIFVIIALVGIKISSKKRSNDIANGILPSEKKISSYSLRLLIMFGVVILSLITLALISAVVMSITDRTLWTGNFWANAIPFVSLIIFTGIGAFGVFKLIQLLRK